MLLLLCNYVILCIIDSLPYQSVQMVVHDKPGMNESYKLVCRVNYPGENKEELVRQLSIAYCYLHREKKRNYRTWSLWLWIDNTSHVQSFEVKFNLTI